MQTTPCYLATYFGSGTRYRIALVLDPEGGWRWLALDYWWNGWTSGVGTSTQEVRWSDARGACPVDMAHVVHVVRQMARAARTATPPLLP